MKTFKKTVCILAVLLLTTLAASCTSTGNYMPLKEGETIIGTVQTTFVVQSTSVVSKSGKDALNRQAYAKLLETAERKYPNSNIDIRDIEWVTGNTVENTKTEIFATAKVIRVE
jgi:hypothetical protein